jgi:hypothetical protein
MTDHSDPAQQRQFPSNWDVLDRIEDDELPPPDEPPVPSPSHTPPLLNLIASSWADVVVVLAVCTAALLALNAAGHHSRLVVLPWAAALGLMWWLGAAATLVTIRQGTPGMLLAGVHFRDRVTPGRVALVVVVAVLSALLLGLPGLLGGRHSPLAIAAGSRLESVPIE